VRVGAYDFVWLMVEVFVFDSYVHDSYSGSLYEWGTVADLGVNFNVGLFCFGFLQWLDTSLMIMFVWLFLTLIMMIICH